MHLRKGFLMGVLVMAPLVANGGEEKCANVNAVINPGNQQVVEAVLVNGVRVPTTVTLDGGNSNPKKSVTCQWKQDSGAKVTIADPQSCTTTFAAPDVGPSGQDLKFTLQVRSTQTGCTDLTDANSTTINVANVITNRPPVAVVAAPLSVSEGVAVALDGRASSDADGDSLTFTWAQISGTPVELTAVAPGLVTFTAPPEQYPNGESLTFRVTVSDGYLSDSAEIQIAVQSVNQAPVAAVRCPPEVAEGDLVVLTDEGSHDPDEGALTYLWSNLLGGPTPDLTGLELTGPMLAFPAPKLTAPIFDTMKFGLTVTDQGSLSGSALCDVKVLDVTPPVMTGANPVTEEATSSSGAVVSYSPVAHDAFYGDVEVTCAPPSESVFPLGETQVTCRASDLARTPNTAEAVFKVTVADTTPPVLNLPESLGPIEGNTLGGALVKYAASASDRVDGPVEVTCDTPSGALLPVGKTTVTCRASDAHNNLATGGFAVTVQDTTAPVVEVPAGIVAEATGPYGAPVIFSATAQDVVDGTRVPTCVPASGSVFALGKSTVSCTATDKSDNKAYSNFEVVVKDTTAPVVTPPADLTVYATGALTPVNLGNATATDAVGVSSITNDAPPDGFQVGTKTVTWTAIDEAGNKGTATSAVTIKGWTLSGFYLPVAMNLPNAVKGGATVPLKFRVFAGTSEITDTAAVSGIKMAAVPCGSMTAANESSPINCAATGGTGLRYDATERHFIFNWQPTKGPDLCYIVSVSTVDGSQITATFKMK